MTKTGDSSGTNSGHGLRISRNRASGREIVIVAWKYPHERGQTVWLRPTTGLAIARTTAARTR
ncbi:hypothetical protein ACFC1I_13770 [Microbacterium sp. NPDC056044]|uniref:hypothetical protein n=1 Tax=Microbacterium sp. NPDC056044 TaxID=3345690 RepID=UPI0035DA1620